MKGVLLAGGSGSRLRPLTLAVNKHLLPVYDRPMVYFPLCTLMAAGVRDVAVVSGPADLPRFQALLGSGAQWGISLSYAAQPAPEGIAQALLSAGDFVGRDPVAVILGDNLFDGPSLGARLRRAAARPRGAVVFGRRVRSPRRYGVAELDARGRVVSLEEKPAEPRSDVAVTGLYLYGGGVLDRARAVRRSARGEYEITALNQEYLVRGELSLVPLGDEVTWRDMGTPDALHAAGRWAAREARRGRWPGCPEEAALRMGYVGPAALEERAARAPGRYGRHLRRLLRAAQAGAAPLPPDAAAKSGQTACDAVPG